MAFPLGRDGRAPADQPHHRGGPLPDGRARARRRIVRRVPRQRQGRRARRRLGRARSVAHMFSTDQQVGYFDGEGDAERRQPASVRVAPCPPRCDTRRCTTRTSRSGRGWSPFAGWEMPRSYDGVIAEHLAVRATAGVFDVSHMGQIETSGPRRARATRARLAQTTSPRSRSAAPSTRCCCARTAACSTTSSTTASRPSRYLTVTNAANHERDLAWFARARPRPRRGGL